MKLLVGWGNPGPKYTSTRHNVGFEVLQILRKHWQVGALRNQFQAEICEASVPRKTVDGAAINESEKVLLIWPQTFMNLSGSAVLAARDFYKIPHHEILVICDDFAIPLGRLRIRMSGSAGGQNGLADVLRRLGTNEIPRLRIGVGPLPAGWDAADFVLGRFAVAERTEMELSLQTAADAAAYWAATGNLQQTMNKYNPPAN